MRGRLVVVAWVLVTVTGLAAATQVFDELSSSLDPAATSEAETTEARLIALTGTDGRVVILVEGDPSDPATAESIAGVSAALAGTSGVRSVVDHRAGGESLVADDRTSSLIIVDLEAGLGDEAEELLLAEIAGIADAHLGERARLAGPAIVDTELGDTAEGDLVRADLLALPIVMALLGLVLRSWRAAAMGGIIVIVTIAGALGAVYALSQVTEVSVFAVNVVSMFAIGLTVDYCLLTIHRYRTEKGEGHDHRAAVSAARRHAGQVVTFSGLTVSVALAGLVAFREPVLRSLAYGGIAATLIAVAAARTLLPILIGRWGPRIPVAPASQLADHGALARLATVVQRHALVATLGSVALLAVLALPLLRLDFTGLDVRSLPADSPTRTVSETVSAHFPDLRAEPLSVLLEPSPTPVALETFVASIDQLAGVGATSATTLDDATVIDVVPSAATSDKAAQNLVVDLRALPTPARTEVSVTGEAAEDVDLIDSIAGRLAVALGIAMGGTLLLLFAFTGSILIPIKAVAVTIASLAASLGVLVYVFQEGHGASLAGYTPLGGLDAIILLVAGTFAFGLSTDYEVFLLGAILEQRDAGEPTDTAVAHGLQRSGRIITTAAALILVVFLGFAAGDLAIVKQLGVGLAIAVVLDVTLVRLVLVPATMTLAGRANWWSPPALARMHRRLGVEHP